MIVKELISKLLQYDENYEVLYAYGENVAAEIEDVKIINNAAGDSAVFIE